MNNQNNEAANMALSRINEVEGFDPWQYAVDFTDSTTGETYKRLPVMAQMAWFRLKYPMGKIAVRIAGGNDCFVATARIYADYKDVENCFLSEATASRGFLEDKPSISPREWAQTAAVGVALRNAGFGLQFKIAGDSFPEVAPNEFAEGNTVMLGTAGGPGGYYDMGQPEMADATTVPVMQPGEWQMQPVQQPYAGMPNMQQPQAGMPAPSVHPALAQISGGMPGIQPAPAQQVQTGLQEIQPEEKELSYEERIQKAMEMPCPIKKYSGKTLGDLIVADPKALTWIATKFKGGQEMTDAATLICEYALGQACA